MKIQAFQKEKITTPLDFAAQHKAGAAKIFAAEKPQVSVLMTAFNREIFIAEAIESVLNSTFRNLELIIVDDCSTDKTLEVAKHYASSDSRIRVYLNEKNLGDYPNRNRAASYAKGEFLLFVDSDDRILLDGIENCVSAMQAFPESGMGMQWDDKETEPFFLTATQVIRRHFLIKPCLMIGPGGTIMRRNIFEKMEGYPTRYGPANDMYFNLKMAAIGGMLFLPFTFNFYRIHKGQESDNQYSYLYNNYCYLRDALAELALPLHENEKKWIGNKNRRRFLVNLFWFSIRSRNISLVLEARKKAGFNRHDAWKAIYHQSL